MAELSIVESGDLFTHVAVSGRLDTEGVDDIATSFAAHTAARRRPAIVDLTGVTFLASLGMGMLIRAAKALRQHQVGMVLLGPIEPVERALRAARVDEVIPIVRARDEALGVLRVA
jgi:anti-anti-sigma factor